MINEHTKNIGIEIRLNWLQIQFDMPLCPFLKIGIKMSTLGIWGANEIMYIKALSVPYVKYVLNVSSLSLSSPLI